MTAALLRWWTVPKHNSHSNPSSTGESRGSRKNLSLPSLALSTAHIHSSEYRNMVCWPAIGKVTFRQVRPPHQESKLRQKIWRGWKWNSSLETRNEVTSAAAIFCERSAILGTGIAANEVPFLSFGKTSFYNLLRRS